MQNDTEPRAAEEEKRSSTAPKTRKLKPLLQIILVLLVGIVALFLFCSSIIRKKTEMSTDGEPNSGIAISAAKNTENSSGVQTEHIVWQEAEQTVEKSSDPQGDWHNNLLKEEHGAVGKKKKDGSWPKAKATVFGVDTWIREQIFGVAVQDTLEGVPESAVDISQEGNGNVQGWLDDRKTLHIAGDGGIMAPADSAALFAHMKNVRSIDLRGLHTDNTYDLSFLFYHCENLETVNLEGIVTDNVTDLTRMFTGCNALKSVNLSGFNTQKVGSFAAMFQNCSSLQELDLTAFNTESATTFWMMFRGCSNLRNIVWNPRFFVTNHVTNMNLMFYECTSLSYVNVSEFNMANVKGMNSAFFGCSALAGIDTSRWDMSNVDNIAHLFGNCESLFWIDTGGWNLKTSVDRTEIFLGSGLEKYGPNGETLFG